jgi:hypothetical protein
MPAAALGLAAAVIAVASAITTANAVAEVVLRFPTNGDALVAVTGPGVFVTIAGGLICVIAGLSRPPTLSSEARIDMQPGQPEFAVIASALVVVALIAGLLGAWIGSNGQRTTTQGQAAFPTDLLSMPVIDAQVTPLGPAGATVEPTPGAGVETPIPTPPSFETPLPPTRTLQPTFGPTLTPLPTETVASPLGTPTATEQTFSAGPATTTPTATFGPSPLGP